MVACQGKDEPVGGWVRLFVDANQGGVEMNGGYVVCYERSYLDLSDQTTFAMCLSGGTRESWFDHAELIRTRQALAMSHNIDPMNY